MGLLLKLLALPVSGPIEGVIWIADKIAEQADQEMYNEDAVRGQLMELELRLDMGEISEQEFEESETALLDHLRVIRERQAAAASVDTE
jgi:hypothetical protein